MPGNWIGKAVAGMKKRGTVGAFTKQAKKAGAGVQEYASDVLKPGSKASPTTKKRAVFARNVGKIARKG